MRAVVPLLLLLGVSCSKEPDRTVPPNGALPATAPIAGESIAGIRTAILASHLCRPPPCDDVGACAMLPPTEVARLNCTFTENGFEARCAYEVKLTEPGRPPQHLEQRALTSPFRWQPKSHHWCLWK